MEILIVLLMHILSGLILKGSKGDNMEEKYVIFELGEQKYCMRLMRINGIEQNSKIIPIPIGPVNIKGIINLREEVIPVFNLKSKFNMEDTTYSVESELLISQIQDMKVAFEVDNVIAIETVDIKSVKEVPAVVKTNDTDYIENIIHLKDDIIISISVDNIMSSHEYMDLTKIIEENQ